MNESEHADSIHADTERSADNRQRFDRTYLDLKLEANDKAHDEILEMVRDVQVTVQNTDTLLRGNGTPGLRAEVDWQGKILKGILWFGGLVVGALVVAVVSLIFKV